MKKEFDLSKKIETEKELARKLNIEVYFAVVRIEVDVKEFIKLTKEDLDLVRTGKMSISKTIRRFKQRAGEKLK